ncbi:hypothetical protein PIB30_079004 [Stylosanthes scabra]|uniref:Uncharacterized protein n=1 Tax=Stylosanthes scabra TaxID=79078 RepID=A0ABU6WS71_9FABA|nr:hypothetical protein [Stylosanthes scabra]
MLIGEMKGKSRKEGIGREPRAFLTKYTRVNKRKHDRAKFGAEVAKKGKRNEKIAKKNLKGKIWTLCVRTTSPWAACPELRTEPITYAPNGSVRMHQRVPASINRGAFTIPKGSRFTISLV